MISSLQATGYFFPDSTGGTEVYVEGLARGLEQLGCATTVIAPSADMSAADHSWRGLRVRRYPWGYAGDQAHAGFDKFLGLLDQSRADIYHQHSWSGGCSDLHLRAAKERGFRTVTTVHMAGNICLSGTMMRAGKQPCDGRLDEQVCSECWAVSRKGVPAAIARPIARLSRMAVRGGAPLMKSLAGLTSAFDGHRVRFEHMARHSDRIVAVCQWAFDALLLNGIAREKLSLCRQGIEDALPPALRRPERVAGSALRVGFLGRYDPIKGLHVLARAFRRLPAVLPIELHIHGVANGPAERDYAAVIRSIADGDPRIHFLPPVGREAIWDALSGFDVLAVPSQLLETGPLVVIEAQAAGTPVLGSDLGGISELVTRGSRGWLVAHDSVDAWAAELKRLSEARDAACGPMPARDVRTMRDVACETLELYAGLAA